MTLLEAIDHLRKMHAESVGCREFWDAQALDACIDALTDHDAKQRRDRALVAAGVDTATGGVCGVGDEEADGLIAQVDAMLAKADR